MTSRCICTYEGAWYDRRWDRHARCPVHGKLEHLDIEQAALARRVRKRIQYTEKQIQGLQAGLAADQLWLAELETK